MLTRRMFTGLGLAALVNALLPGRKPIPRIIGDGIADDTEGILAAINGRPFVSDIVRRVGDTIFFGEGNYLMTQSFKMETPGLHAAAKHGAKILCDHDDSMFHMGLKRGDEGKVYASNFHFETVKGSNHRPFAAWWFTDLEGYNDGSDRHCIVLPGDVASINSNGGGHGYEGTG